MKSWPRHFRCAYCRGHVRGADNRATIRVFSGVSRSGGASVAGGYPACNLCHGQAFADALSTFGKYGCPPDWEVRAYRVTADEHDDPVMTHLWTAKAAP